MLWADGEQVNEIEWVRAGLNFRNKPSRRFGCRYKEGCILYVSYIGVAAMYVLYCDYVCLLVKKLSWAMDLGRGESTCNDTRLMS